MMKNLETLQELPKFDTKTRNEQMLLEKNSSQSCHKSSICKKYSIREVQ